MKFDKETIIALIVCVAVILAWPFVTKLFEDEKAPVEKSVTTTVPATAAKPAEAAAPAKTAAPAKPVVKSEPKCVTISNADLQLDIMTDWASVYKVTYLKHFAKDGSKLVSPYQDNLGAFQLLGKNWQQEKPVVEKINDRSCAITRNITTAQGNVVVKQIFSLGEKGYVVKCKYEFSAPKADKEVVLTDMIVYGAEIAPWHVVSGDKKRAVSHRIDYRVTYGENDDIQSSEDDEDFFFVRPPEVFWSSVSNKYFCTVFKRDDVERGGYIIWQHRRFIPGKKEDEKEPIIGVGAVLPPVKIARGKTATMEFSTYDGPKDIDALSDFAGGAAGVMHLAWGPLNYLARFLLWILTMFHSLCNSWGVSIILLTILVRGVFYPITSRGNESMKKMQRVQPKFKELREKYKDNPQLLNQKMAELYRAEGVNPFAGCLPILLQIPIFFALYAMLDNAIDLRHVSFLWCKDLAASDTIFSIPLGFTLPLLNINAIPINPLVLAMTALMVVQQRMTPMSMDPAQKKMMALMPIVMLFFLYDLPSGLTLYWTVSNLFSILQLWLQKKRGEKAAADQPKTQGN